MLMPAVNVMTCVRIVTVAHELKAQELKAFAADMVMERWNDIDPADFAALSAELLYEMLKMKTKYPLHRAILHQREDVVFMFLLEFDLELAVKINEKDDSGNSPLHLALLTKNESIGNTLVNHGANVNASREDGVRLLHAAIDRGDAFAAIFLIQHGANVNDVGKEQRVPLHCAAEQNLVDVAQTLIGNGANVNAINDHGNTPIQSAIVAGHIDAVELFLATPNVDVNTRNRDGHTALWLALELETQDVARALVDRGCDINLCTASGDSMLHSAVHRQNETAALFLIANGASCQLSNERRETPLHIAASHGLVHVGEALIGKGASMNAQDSELHTPLMRAIVGGHKPFVQMLLAQGRGGGGDNPFGAAGGGAVRLEINLTSSSGASALGLALAAGLLDIAEWLLQAGADIEARTAGATLLHQSILRGDAPSALFLLDRGANVHAPTDDATEAGTDGSATAAAGSDVPGNKTPLSLAITAGLEDVVAKLCGLGADVNHMEEDGSTPLWLALQLKKEKVAFVLVRHKCNLDHVFPGEGGGEPALHRAIGLQDAFAATFLIRNGANVNIKTGAAKQHEMPLHAACEHGLVPVVSALMQHKGNVNAAAADGATPAHRAVAKAQKEVLQALLKHPQLNLKARDKEELTAFGLAIMTKQPALANMIKAREAGAADEPDSKGMGLLHKVISKGDGDSVALLLKCGVSVNRPTHDAAQRTPLTCAVERGDEAIVQQLLKAKADFRVPDRMSKWTVAHVAASLGFVSILKMLIQVKADMNAVDDLGESVLHSAIRAGQYEVSWFGALISNP